MYQGFHCFGQFYLNFGSCLKRALVVVVVVAGLRFDQFYLNFGSCLKKALVVVVVVAGISFDQFHLNFGSCLKKALVVVVAVAGLRFDQFYLNFGSCLKKALVVAGVCVKKVYFHQFYLILYSMLNLIFLIVMLRSARGAQQFHFSNAGSLKVALLSH